jgi:hypothetical protein
VKSVFLAIPASPIGSASGSWVECPQSIPAFSRGAEICLRITLEFVIRVSYLNGISCVDGPLVRTQFGMLACFV